MDAAGPLIVSGYIRDDDDDDEEEAPLLGFGVRFYIVGGRDRDIYLLSFLDYRCPSCVRFQKVSYRKFRQSFGSYSSPGSRLRCALILHSVLLKIFGMEVS